jgi:hypothetical protein
MTEQALQVLALHLEKTLAPQSEIRKKGILFD